MPASRGISLGTVSSLCPWQAGSVPTETSLLQGGRLDASLKGDDLCFDIFFASFKIFLFCCCHFSPVIGKFLFGLVFILTVRVGKIMQFFFFFPKKKLIYKQRRQKPLSFSHPAMTAIICEQAVPEEPQQMPMAIQHSSAAGSGDRPVLCRARFCRNRALTLVIS